MENQKLFEELLEKKGIYFPREKGPRLVRRDDTGPFKLSFAQHRLWFLQQFDGKSAAYNDPTAFRIKGPLNIPIMEQTFNEMMRRHRVLRMNFPADKGEPIQVLNNNIKGIKIPVVPLEKKSRRQVEERIRELTNDFSRQPFDLSVDTLLRVKILKIDAGDHVLLVNSHHIVSDGWSKGIMLKEMIALYEAFSKDEVTPLEELPLQYTDYVYWQHKWMQGQRYQSQLEYWQQKLAGAPPVLELPSDFPRPNLPGGGGSLEPFPLSKQKFRALNELANRENVTLFMLLLAAFNTLLWRYIGREDILIGTPIAGRHQLELENLIGLFANTLVLRNDLSGDPTFKMLLKRVRSAAVEAYENQDMPFEKLVEALNPQRNLSVTPLFQVMFQLQNAPMPPAHIAGLTFIPIPIDTGFSQVDLSLTLWEEDGSMKGTFEYNTDLWEAVSIRRMIGHFQVLLAGIIAEPAGKIHRLPVLTEEERYRLVVEWNSTHADYSRELRVWELFENCAQKNPHEAAVMIGDQRLTYAKLNQQANGLGQFLQNLGVGPEVLVGICMENSLELIVGVMGILKAGGAYVPLDPEYPRHRLTAALQDACPPVLITQTSYSKQFEGYNGKLLYLDRGMAALAGQRTDNCKNHFKPGDGACVIYTSGSTGKPKGILIGNRNIVNLINSFTRSYHPGPGDKILPLTSLASASFVGEILPILTSGGSIVLALKVHFLDIKRLITLLSDYQITILSTVPSMIARLNSSSGEWNPGRLRLLLSGGEALSVGDIDFLKQTVTIVNGYGLTEATVCSTYLLVDENRVNHSNHPMIPVGRPIINTGVYILDKYRNPVPIGVPGEIYIAGDGLARGYLNNPELTCEKFKIINYELTPIETASNEKLLRGVQGGGFLEKSPPGRLFKTGDLGVWLPDGTIRFLGRLDTQVQIHGHRVELTEIETLLGLHPGIRAVKVIDRELDPGNKQLVVYFVPGKDKSFTGTQLRDWLSKRIPGYMIPGVFEKLESIPLNPNGKVNIDALPVPSGTRPQLAVGFKAPQTGIEREIAAVWQEFLHLDKIGIHDNFFDLGGHSLLLTRVHHRLNEMYKNKKELTIVDLFQYSTVYELAKYIGDSREQGQQSAETYRKIKERANKQRQAFNRQRFKVRSNS